MLQSIFDLQGYLPHGYCFTWTPALLWTMVGADAVIAASYFSIPVAIATLLRRRGRRSTDWMAWLFVSFIVACGVTHVIDIGVVWVPAYGVQALAKTVAALISLATAVALWPMLPKLLKMRSAEDLQAVVDQLRLSEAHQSQLLLAARQAAQELALSEQRYRSLFERNPDAVYAFDTMGRFTSVNPTFEALTGIGAVEALAGHFLPIVAPESAEHTMACFARAVAGEAMHYEATCIHRDGSRLLVDVTNLPIVVDGEIVGVFGIAKDITARKQAERRQREEEQRFATIVAEAVSGIAVTDMEGKFLEANKAYCQMVGYSLAELQQRNLRDLTHPDDLPRNLDLLSAALQRDPASFIIEKRYICKSGAVSWVRASVTIIRDEDRHPLHIVGIFEDITRVKVAADELQRSQALVSIAGRVALVGGWSVDLPGDRVLWSDVVAAIHEEPAEYSPDVDAAIQYYQQSDRERVRSAFEECAASGLPFDLELQIITATGKRRWVRTLGEAVRNEHDQIHQVRGAFQDISERKSVELENQALTRRLSQTLASITDGFFTIDGGSRFVFVNAEAERLLGRSAKELTGREIWGEFPQARDGEFERRLKQAMDNRQTVTFETLLTRSNVWLRMSAYPSDDGLVVYFRDISAERETRTELELLQASVSRLHDIVLITEASPNDEPGPRIVFVNEAFIRTTGYAREEVLGRSPRMLQGPLTQRRDLDRIREAIRRFEPVHAELINYSKTGKPYWVEIDIVPVNQQGGTCSHFVAIERDITDRKRHEEELRQLNIDLESRVLTRTAEAEQARLDAERANRAKSDFLATMSHEIRTPMNGVVGMLDVLEHSPLDGDQREIVDAARESAYALLSIVDDVLDISKIEAGQLDVEREPIDPAEVIERACVSFEWMATQKGVRLRLYVDPALPRRVLGDALRLRQVVLNLLSNAIKFSSGLQHEGVVSVRAMLCQASASPTLLLQIVDNGVGIDTATLDRLFQPFTQADAGTTRRYGGTGLGLTICRALVEKMGGSIAAESQLGSGSSFVLKLPLVSLPAPDAHAHAHAMALAGVTCLLIGKPADRADDFCKYLQHSGSLVAMVPDVTSASGFLAAMPRGICVCLLLGTGERIKADEAELLRMARSLQDVQIRLIGLDCERHGLPRVGLAGSACLPSDLLLRDDLVSTVLAVSRPCAPGETLFAAAPQPQNLQRLMLMPGAARILVAEDNEINRKVLLRQLDLLGLGADLAANGDEALAMWRRDQHLMLLTDLHMPGMDGFSLAAAVRLAESGGQRMPIVALTANALQSESQRCAQAGMDDCMTKPVRLKQLRDMLLKWLPSQSLAESGDDLRGKADGATVAVTASSAAAEATTDPVDLQALKDLIGSDPTAIREMLEIFCRCAERSRIVIESASQGARWVELADAAHTLKSSARSIGAMRLGSICERLESMADAADMQAVSTLTAAFTLEFGSVFSFVQRHLGQLELPPENPGVS